MINNVKLVDDQFVFKDLNIEGLTKYNTYHINSSVPRSGCYYYPDEIVAFDTTFSLHKSLYGQHDVTCLRLLKILYKLLYYSESAIIVTGSKKLKLQKCTIDSIQCIMDQLKSGFITINNVKIDLSQYETDGEYFEIECDKARYVLNRVKKYYTTFDNQYTIFFSDGSIRSISNVNEVKMSKDVRLTKEELERLWKL